MRTCAAKMETPPVPWVKTTWPAFSGLPSRPKSAFQAVTAAQDKVAASWKLKVQGISTKPSWSKTLYSVRVPSKTPPRPVAAEGMVNEAAWCPWLKRVTTLSPTLNLVTLGPTATTSPAPSEPGTTGRFKGNG